jgi:outer membrane protein assembly factor BamB
MKTGTRRAGLGLCVWLTSALAGAGVVETEWAVDVPGGTVGHPVPYPSIESARGVLVTAGAGKVIVYDRQGKPGVTMALDLPASAPAVVGKLWGDGPPGVVAVDSWGSVYAFDASGRRRWKYERTSSAGGFRLPVLADLDGDGRPEILTSDARGTLVALNGGGKLVLEIHATHYRLSPPAVGDVDGDGVVDLVFGTEDKEIHCVSARGDYKWSRRVEARFGRSLPVVADADADGAYEVYVSSSYNQAKPGLFCLDAATGALKWKAESTLQAYDSTVVADLDGDGRSEIVFGDKNTRLYRIDPKGHQEWSTQLGGKGIFFAPAVADLNGDGRATIFSVVRASGPEGFGLYLLDPSGKVLEGVALPGGGVASPSLCRFEGTPGVRLLAYSGSGKLHCYRIAQDKERARIVWAGLRNDDGQTGFVASKVQPKRIAVAEPAGEELPGSSAWSGTNWIAHGNFLDDLTTAGLARRPRPEHHEDYVAGVRVAGPDGVVRTELVRGRPDTFGVLSSFLAREPGAYKVDVRWRDADGKLVERTRTEYTLAPNFQSDEAEFRRLETDLSKWKDSCADYARLSARADLEFATLRREPDQFDEARARRFYLMALAGRMAKVPAHGVARVGVINNPWDNFDATSFFRSETKAAVELSMLGNEYESVALGVTNLQPREATFRLAFSPFETYGKAATPARDVVEARDVPLVRVQSTGGVTEDVLPRLGEGNTVRLGPLETRKVWLTFRSRDLKPGTHRATLRVGDLLSLDPPLQVPVTVEVLDYRLPDRLTYCHGNWLMLAGITDPALREATIKDALEHGTNVFNVPQVTVQFDKDGKITGSKTEPHDTIVKRLKGRAFFMINGSAGVAWPEGFKPSHEAEEKAYAEAIRWYTRHMKELGVAPEDYAFYTMDEPGLMGRDAAFEKYVEGVKRIKAADPDVQIYANPAGGARAEVIGPVAPLIDVWQPDLHLVREQPEALGALFGRGKRYWHYEAPGDQRNIDPLGYYRMKPWVAFQMGMTGGGYWVYSQADYWFFDRAMGAEYGTVYPTDAGPVTTKRWEASRDGAEDFEILWQLREAAGHSSSPTAAEAKRVLAEAVAFVTRDQETASDIGRQLHPFRPDYGRWMAYRRQMVDLLIRLKAGK